MKIDFFRGNYLGWTIYEENTKLTSQLGEEKQDKFHQLWATNKWMTDNLAVASVTTDPNLRKEMILSMNQKSFALTRLWDWGFRDLFETRDIHFFYSDIVTLSGNILAKEPSQSFSEQELKQLKLAHDYLTIIDDSLSKVWDLKLSREEWIDIMQHPKVQSIARNAANELSQLPALDVKPKSQKHVEPIRQYTGEKVSLDEAVQKAKEFIGSKMSGKYDWRQSGGGSDQYGNEYYKISPITKGTNRLAEDIEIEVSVQGGHIIRYSKGMGNPEKEEKYGEPKFSVKEAEEVAYQYLKRWKADIEMQLIETRKRGSVVSFIFGSEIKGIPVYHDRIEMTVALDKGDLIRFDAWLFYRSYRPDREIPEPELTMDQARQKIHPDVEVHDEGMAVIRNRERSEVLTYRFREKRKPNMIIFINAINGEEELILTSDGGQY